MREELARRYLETAEAALAGVKDALKPLPASGSALANAEAMQRDLKLRDAHFPDGAFADYRWHALLALFCATVEEREVRFLDLFREIGAPHTTGKRIVDELQTAGFVSIRSGDYSKARKLVSMTPVGIGKLEAYFALRAGQTEAAAASTENHRRGPPAR